MINHDDDSVQIARNLQELEKVRSEHARNKDERGVNGTGYVETGAGGDREKQGSHNGIDSRVERGTQGAGEIDRSAKTIRKRVRPTHGTDIDSTKGDGGINSGPKGPITEKPSFFDRLRQPKEDNSAPVRLVSESEGQEQRDHLIMVYMFLSSLPDYVLEIIVKDHDPVTIWQLSEDEAGALVDIDLRQAKTDPAAARRVRSTLVLYDRMYRYTLAVPRALATRNHIQEHGGLSLR